MAYYDGTKLLSLKDIDGNKPEIYICTTNRTGGKTTFFGRMEVNRFLRTGEKFILLYRFNYELSNISEKFFKDISGLFFPDYEMTDKPVGKGVFHELFLHKLNSKDSKEGKSCGYALAINNSDQIKKYSHVFTDATSILFDEFQSETNKYCPNEISKFISIHTSVARGHSMAVRYVPVYMLSNMVTIINPYYTELGISERLQNNTKFLKGHGFVLENGFIESASKAQLSSGFNKAFSDNSYVAYASQNVYLNDNTAFIDRPSGNNKYLATIAYNGKEYSLREYADDGIIYCDDHSDETYKYRIAVTTEDHNINYVMLRKNDLFIQNMRYLFDRGCFRFKNLLCKEAIMKLLSY